METPFFNPALDRNEVQPLPLAPEAIYELFHFLDLNRKIDEKTTLAQQIKAGNITLAMIRPALAGMDFVPDATHLDESDLSLARDIKGADAKAAFALESHIQGLGIMAKFSVWFDMPAISKFYAGPRKNMLDKAPDLPNEPGMPVIRNKWEEFANLMRVGPTTILLLHSPNGDAAEIWRSQVGHWDIANRRDPSTIRGRFGVDSYNNLVHGSDGPRAVRRELTIIQDLLHRQLEDV